MPKLKWGGGQAPVVVLLLGAFLLLSCQPAKPVATPTKPAGTPVTTGTKAAETPVKGGTLRITYFADPATLDPHITPAMYPDNSIYDLLVEPDNKGNLTKEGLFKDWTVSGDGKSSTFKLQAGVKFHDGTDLDAAAVKWNIERQKDPATKAAYGSNFAAVASVEVVDSLTVRFNLTRPDPILLSNMTTQGGMMVSPAAVQKLGQDFARKPMGSGPFQFVEWVPGDHITLKRFDGYWRKGQPYLDGVVFKIVTDATVAFASLRTGQTDAYYSAGGFPPEQLPVLKADANLTYSAKLASNIDGMWMNAKKPPFDNKALRQAVALAIDREGIAARLGETARFEASVLQPLTWAYDGKAGVYPPRDLAKAKAKMAEGGYPNGGLKASYVLRADPKPMADAQILKANLAEIGIDVELEVVANPVRLSRVLSLPPVGGDYQMAWGGLLLGLPDPGYIMGLMFHSKGSRNYMGPYSNPQVDQLLDKAGSIYDQGERTAFYRQAANIIAADAPLVPYYVNYRITPMNKKVRAYPDTPLETLGFRGTWLAQ